MVRNPFGNALESSTLLKPIDRLHRDGPLYPGSTKTLKDFIDPQHLLLKVDANFDFENLVEFLLAKYSPDIGRPAIHPEVLVRALVLSAVYDITSYRQLCERIKENLSWRWFCHLTLEDEVFDHSTITVFIERVGADSFQELLDRLNQELLRLQLLSPRMYADSSVVEANVRTESLSPTDLTPEEFAARATEEEGVFTVCEREPAAPEEGGPATVRSLRYQDALGRLPLSHVDPDARWRKPHKHLRAILGYKENLIVDKSGFILARRVTPADAGDFVGVQPLLDRLPLRPRSLCADAGYRSGRLRFLLRRKGIKVYIPLHPTQEVTGSTALVTGEFTFHGDHVRCGQGKVLAPGRFPDSNDIVQYVARQAECQACPVRKDCLAPKEKRKHVGVHRYELEFRHARVVNQTERFRREMNRRKTVVEGVFARLDHLAWDTARLRGIEKVDVQGSIAALTHNILKALRKTRWWRRAASSAPLPERLPNPCRALSSVPVALTPSFVPRHSS